ncbi:MAG: hypothetical protein N2110_01515 [Flavobacteriales bacterium]|nr:hypothetical protein [Flavobacteriales bacterium]
MLAFEIFGKALVKIFKKKPIRDVLGCILKGTIKSVDKKIERFFAGCPKKG